MDLTGFDAVEIDRALAIDEPGVGAIETEAAENLAPIATPSVRRGDVYLLVRHAIACGDARDADLVTRFKHGRAPHQNNFELGQHGRSRPNVWPYRGVNAFGKSRMELLESHPTEKPTLMIADALKDVSRPGDLVFDPFLGSGSTLLAAEETGRTCLGIEFDPGYVEVAIRRWEKRTRRDAVNADTGQTFSSLFEHRPIAPSVAHDAGRPSPGRRPVPVHNKASRPARDAV
jgi:DNA methylase